jgi:hypothetical protein
VEGADWCAVGTGAGPRVSANKTEAAMLVGVATEGRERAGYGSDVPGRCVDEDGGAAPETVAAADAAVGRVGVTK